MMKNIEIDIRIPNQTRFLALVGKIGENLARTLDIYKGDKEELAFNLNLVLTEGLSNAICHANLKDPEKYVHISVALCDNDLLIRIFDEGQGFCLESLNEPIDESTNVIDENGRGIFIIQSIMDKVSYKNLNGGNVLEMSKSLA